MEKKYGIAISTFSDQETPIDRLDAIITSLDSAMNEIYLKNPEIYIIIICDTCIPEHKEILDKYPFEIVYNKKNMGISYTKNIGIKKILDNGCEYGFLLDDDILIKNNQIFDKYIQAMEKTGFHHFSYIIDKQDERFTESINGIKVVNTTFINGVFLTFSKSLIDEVGYFEILPYQYGHEHTAFTNKCIRKKLTPYFIDIVNNDNDIEILNCKCSMNLDDLKVKNNFKVAYNNLSKKIEWNGHPFDPEFYLTTYPDLKQAGLETYEQALKHYNTYGKYEARLPNGKYNGQ